MLLPGEILMSASSVRKSADAIVVDRNEPMNKAEVSQVSEGLNVKSFQMQQGSFL
jgi:hypothetical protein